MWPRAHPARSRADANTGGVLSLKLIEQQGRCRRRSPSGSAHDSQVSDVERRSDEQREAGRQAPSPAASVATYLPAGSTGCPSRPFPSHVQDTSSPLPELRPRRRLSSLGDRDRPGKRNAEARCEEDQLIGSVREADKTRRKRGRVVQLRQPRATRAARDSTAWRRACCPTRRQARVPVPGDGPERNGRARGKFSLPPVTTVAVASGSTCDVEPPREHSSSAASAWARRPRSVASEKGDAHRARVEAPGVGPHDVPVDTPPTRPSNTWPYLSTSRL
jgi:hypothetical protein